MARKKKSYNPFKMGGSWIGASIGFISQFVYGNIFDLSLLSFRIFLDGNNSSATISTSWAVIGFLLGYGIHSLVRYFRK